MTPDRVQICAQAMCLEEMLNVAIDHAFLFYGTKQRRTEVTIDESLRNITLKNIKRLRQLIDGRETPSAVRMPKCDKCSLVELCIPDAQRLRQGVNAWNQRQLTLALAAEQPTADDFDTGLE